MDLKAELLFVLATFWILTFWTVRKYNERALKRDRTQWFIDILGLLQQGFLFPLIQTYFLFYLFNLYIPSAKGVIYLHWSLSFLIQFIIIDYLYYWNHRLLHTKILWPFHRLHHSAQKLDVGVSSRNSFWSSFFIIYLWIHAFFIFLLNDPKSFLWAIALGNALDLWRHSGKRHSPKIERFLNNFLVLPTDHEWHHSNKVYDVNFSANFIIWDKLHGTYFKSNSVCPSLGERLKDSFWCQWLTPWRMK